MGAKQPWNSFSPKRNTVQYVIDLRGPQLLAGHGDRVGGLWRGRGHDHVGLALRDQLAGHLRGPGRAGLAVRHEHVELVGAAADLDAVLVSRALPDLVEHVLVAGGEAGQFAGEGRHEADVDGRARGREGGGGARRTAGRRQTARAYQPDH
jgi:hypothetical protein